MDLEPIWEFFIKQLTSHQDIQTAFQKNITGIPFLYIMVKSPFTQLQLEQEIMKSSAAAMKGRRLHSETVFVRQERLQYVYRHRFLVPQEKMFCCGNLCKDCTRLRK
ncbi:MAG: hypothetical protein AB2392_04280 [Neobacillus sp.]